MSHNRISNKICAALLSLITAGFTGAVFSCGQIVEPVGDSEIFSESTTSSPAASTAAQSDSTSAGTATTAVTTEVTTSSAAESATQPPVPETEAVEESAEEQAGSAETEEETTHEEPVYESSVDPGSWELQLVNSSHSLPEGYSFELTTLSNGMSVDSRIYPALEQMFSDMRAQGYAPFVREGYRTHEDQEAIMSNRINSYISQGYSYENAEAQARTYVAVPGTSEHELGLAVDINSEYGYDEYNMYSWLAQNAYKYGFILRYPDGGAWITGISYEPWHYRYVGEAAEIYSSGLTLEEYLAQWG